MVSNKFLDTYMPSANGEFVKVYLYLLRCSTMSDPELSLCRIADTFNHTEKDIIRALKYWEQMGLISLSYDKNDNISGIEFCEHKEIAEHRAAPVNSFLVPAGGLEVSVTADIDSTTETGTPKKHTYSQSEIESLSEANDEIAQLLYIGQMYLGRTLNKTDVNTLIYIYNDLHFSLELMEYLLDYCASNNHTSIRYLESIALNWHEKKVSSVEEAKKESSIYKKEYYTVLKAFGLSGRNPSQSEIDYITKWTTEYGFSIDLIADACNRTIDAIHQPSFKYADSILQDWKNNGIRIKADILNLDNKHKANASRGRNTSSPKNSFNNFQQRNYDFSELEKELLANNKI